MCFPKEGVSAILRDLKVIIVMSLLHILNIASENDNEVIRASFTMPPQE